MAHIEHDIRIIECEIRQAIVRDNRVPIVQPIHRSSQIADIVWKTMARGWRWNWNQVTIVVLQMQRNNAAIKIVQSAGNCGSLSQLEGYGKIAIGRKVAFLVDSDTPPQHSPRRDQRRR
jgi:hypothetical protein